MKYEIGLRTIIGGAFLAAGFTYLASGLHLVHKANASRRWPSVDGVIASSTLEKVKGEDEDAFRRPNIGYSFSVDGESYYSAHLAFPSGGSERLKKANKIVEKYPVGKAVRVFYNPANPWESVLEPGEYSRTWDNVAVAIVFLFIGRVVYRNPQPKGAKRAAPDSAIVHVYLRFNLLTACLWVLGGMFMARTYGSPDGPMGCVTASASVLLGVCAEALWRRSWRVLRANVEGVLGILAWQIILIQSGVTNLSLDVLTVVVASTAVGYYKSRARAEGVMPRPAETAGGEPCETSWAEVGAGSKPRRSLKSVMRRTMFYVLSGCVLFLAMMILRQWAEDDESRLQPMYAWMAALAFLVIVAGMLFGLAHWRCENCGKLLDEPEKSRRKKEYVRCSKCGHVNYY